MKSWSQEEISYLKENFIALTNEELAANLNRTHKAISRMSQKLKMPLRRASWSEDEIKVLNDNLGMSPNELATVLSRPYISVLKKMQQLGLR